MTNSASTPPLPSSVPCSGLPCGLFWSVTHFRVRRGWKWAKVEFDQFHGFHPKSRSDDAYDALAFISVEWSDGVLLLASLYADRRQGFSLSRTVSVPGEPLGACSPAKPFLATHGTNIS
jgi:hypothetical protein